MGSSKKICSYFFNRQEIKYNIPKNTDSYKINYSWEEM